MADRLQRTDGRDDACARYQPLVAAAGSFAAGIALDRLFAIALSAWWIIATIALAVWLLLLRREHRLAGAMLVLAIAALGGSWHHVRWRLFSCDELGLAARDAAQPICLEAIARSAPVRIPADGFDPMRAIPSFDVSRLEIDTSAVRDRDQWLTASGRTTLLVEGHLLNVRAGDHVRIVGMLSATRPAANPGEFDFANHARADRQLCVLRCSFPECVTAIEPASRLSPVRWMQSLRSSADALLWQHLDHERSGLASAVLLGSREQVDDDRTQAFLTTGTIHVLSISGLHVGMLSMILMLSLRAGWMSQRKALAAVVLVTAMYVHLTGAEPPAIRAGIMVAIVCGALATGRRVVAFNALAAAVLCLLVLCPADLFRTGPQLSFLSVGCLIWIAPRWRAWHQQDALDRLVASARPWHLRATHWLARWAWRMTVTSALLWCVTLPLIMARFHLVSPSALVLNTVLSPAVFLAMMTGFATMVLGSVFAPIGAACGFMCDRSLRCLDGSVSAFSELPGSHFWVTGPADWWLAGFYALVIACALAPWLLRPQWRIALLCGWCAVGVIFSTTMKDRDGLDCTFIAVGHGCSVLVELPGGKNVLYDAGQLGSPEAAARSIASCLWSRGLTHLDAVVISHADVDHYNALPALLEQFSVGVVYVSPVMFDEKTPALQKLVAALDRYSVPLREIWSGDRLSTDDGCRIEVLHPSKQGVLGSDNANSIVLSLEYAGGRILLTGDLETPGLEEVLAEAPLDCDVVLAPHHGSHHSDPQGFAAWATPEWVVISGGVSEELDEVHASFQLTGSHVLHTAESGAVRVSIAEDGELAASGFRH